MFSANDLIEQLKKFCFPVGCPVIVHTSMKAVGEIDGGADTLLSVLINYFTQNNGLLCVPSHTWTSLKLDLRNPESCLGVLPNIALKHPLGTRSMHPTHSMVVFGEKNKVTKFLEDESLSVTPTSPDGCYGNIIKEHGYVLLIGVDQRKNTMIHCIEELLNVPGRLTDDMIDFSIIHPDGREEHKFLYWFDERLIPDVSVYFHKLEPAFRYYNCVSDGVIGNAPCQFCSVDKMKTVMELIYKNADGKELLSDDTPIDEKLYK